MLWLIVTAWLIVTRTIKAKRNCFSTTKKEKEEIDDERQRERKRRRDRNVCTFSHNEHAKGI